MLDACVQRKKLKRRLNESGYDVVTTIEEGYEPDEDDKVLVNGTREKGRLLLTNDFNTITEENYPACSHGGILRFPRNKMTDDYIFQRIEALRLLGLAEKVVGHFTYFTDDSIKVVTLHKTPIEKEFNDYEELKDIERE